MGYSLNPPKRQNCHYDESHPQRESPYLKRFDPSKFQKQVQKFRYDDRNIFASGAGVVRRGVLYDNLDRDRKKFEALAGATVSGNGLAIGSSNIGAAAFQLEFDADDNGLYQEVYILDHGNRNGQTFGGDDSIILSNSRAWGTIEQALSADGVVYLCGCEVGAAGEAYAQEIANAVGREVRFSSVTNTVQGVQDTETGEMFFEPIYKYKHIPWQSVSPSSNP